MSERSAGARRDSGERQERDTLLFDAIAERYCRKDLLPASRRARRHRLQRTLREVPLSGESNVLEIGCGAGFASRFLAGRCRTYTGIDSSPELIRIARAHNAAASVHFEATTIAEFRPEERFDLIFMIGVLHHIADREAAMDRIRELARPGGWLAVNEPQPGNPLVRVARRIRKRIDSAYSDEQLEISAAELTSAFERAGFADVRVRPQGVFSTPFAEVALGPQVLTRTLSAGACALDEALETATGGLMRFLSWNLVAVGRKPERRKGDR